MLKAMVLALLLVSTGLQGHTISQLLDFDLFKRPVLTLKIFGDLKSKFPFFRASACCGTERRFATSKMSLARGVASVGWCYPVCFAC